LSDHRIRTACGRIVAYPAQRGMPSKSVSPPSVPEFLHPSSGSVLGDNSTNLSGLVLRDLVLGVLPALLALAEGVSRLGDVDLEKGPCQRAERSCPGCCRPEEAMSSTPRFSISRRQNRTSAFQRPSCRPLSTERDAVGTTKAVFLVPPLLRPRGHLRASVGP